MTTRVTHEQVVAYRLRVNNLVERLPAKEYERAAWVGLQDSGPRDALVGMHARVADCEPTAWADERLVQSYSPRAAVYVLPKKDLGVFTVGRLPSDQAARKEYDDAADLACATIRRGERPDGYGFRMATATGRVLIVWNASSIVAREVPSPDVDHREARRELCRRHLHAFAPTTPECFAWWGGLPLDDALQAWDDQDLAQVHVDGTSAWILATDKPALTAHHQVSGVRLVPAPDLRMFGQDKTGLLVGPGERRRPPRRDSFHPHGVVVDGRLVGAWGRRTGRVRIRLGEDLTADQRAAVEDEALTLPIPNTRMSVEFC